jgi:hypothetical protein
MFCWFAAFSVLGVWTVFRSPGVDYRLVMLGSVLPVGEAVLGGPRLLHTLLAPVVVLAAVMLATRRRRLLRRRLLGLPIGMFFHLVLDGVWMRGQVFWWPFLGWSFGSGEVPELSHGAVGVVLEVIGIGALWWLWREFDLSDPGRRDRFLRTGRLDPDAAPAS